MARPAKYNWERIRAEYECGITQAELVRKYDLNKGRLSDRIKSEGWVVSKQQEAAIKGFRESYETIFETCESAPIVAELAADEIESFDAEMARGIRALNKTLINQSRLIANSGEANAGDLRSLASVSKSVADIHGISKGSGVTINNQNNAVAVAQSIVVRFE